MIRNGLHEYIPVNQVVVNGTISAPPSRTEIPLAVPDHHDPPNLEP